MRITISLLSVAALCVLATASSAATRSSDAPVKKQRVAIEGVFSLGTGRGTFRLTPLTPGPLKEDAGVSKPVGLQSLLTPPSPVVQNGQSVLVFRSTDIYTSRRGGFTVLTKGTLVNAGAQLPDGSRYGVATGTWTLGNGTGVYEGFVGKGAHAEIVFPRSGKSVRYSNEGIVRTG